MGPFETLAHALNQGAVRYVLIGVAGANYYALSGSTSFVTEDRDLFLPPDPDNELLAWGICEAAGLTLWCGDEPLDSPGDRFLAEQIVSRRALVRGEGHGLQIDMTLVMAGFDFDAVWKERRVFRIEGVEVPVARLAHIVTSKAAAGRPKDRLFLATHQEALEQLLKRKDGTT